MQAILTAGHLASVMDGPITADLIMVLITALIMVTAGIMTHSFMTHGMPGVQVGAGADHTGVVTTTAIIMVTTTATMVAEAAGAILMMADQIAIMAIAAA